MKKVGLVLSSTLVLACALLVPTAVEAFGSGVKVSIKTLTKTLLPPTKEHGEQGSVTKGGAPRGKCPGNSAAGALDVATHGRWTAKWYGKYNDVFISSVLGVKPPNSKDFWEVLVNGKPASTGACEIRLRPGQRLEFKIAK